MEQWIKSVPALTEPPKSLIDKAVEYGPWAVVALALGAFLWLGVWPIFRKRFEDADKERAKRLEDADKERVEFTRRYDDQAKLFAASLKEQREADERRAGEQGRIFMDALRQQNVMAAETHEKAMKAHDELLKSQNDLARTQIRMAEKLEILDQHIRNGKDTDK